MLTNQIALLLQQKYLLYHDPKFIEADPLSIPHRFSLLQDIEIAGFFAALLAWGNRTTIINSVNRLLTFMDEAPYAFITQHQETDLKPLLKFVHRTYNATDLLYTIERLKIHYQQYHSLEAAFTTHTYEHPNIREALEHFHNYFFDRPHPERTVKHIATPKKNSACKRLCMYLRWMVRQDNKGIDFGLWQKFSPAQLVCPLDVHVARVAQRLQLTVSEKVSWQTAVQLTDTLKTMAPHDPVRYDFALFGIGKEERF